MSTRNYNPADPRFIGPHANPYQRGHEFSDGQIWFDERWLCNRCRDSRELAREPFAFADERYSFGVYAGRYCDDCWPKSGYRDATDPDAVFDPTFAGERLEEDDY